MPYTFYMAKEIRNSSDQEMYFGALLEDMREKFQIIIEATHQIPDMYTKITHMMEWEEKIKLIPIIFDEVGSLRSDFETLKAAMKLLGKHDDRIKQMEARIQVLEQKERA